MTASPHAIDIGFVFGTHEFSEDSGDFFGRGADADALSAEVQDVWLQFAAEGNPVTDTLQGWKAYDRNDRATAIFGKPVGVESDPYAAERQVWESVEASVGGL